MSAIKLKVLLPYPIYAALQLEIYIKPSQSIREIIQKCLQLQHPRLSLDPDAYRLMIQELGQFLHPDLPFNTYSPYFIQRTTPLSISLIPKNLEDVTVHYLGNGLEFQIDPSQTGFAVSRKAALLIKGKHITLDDWECWGLSDGSTCEKLPSDSSISSVSDREFFLRRETHAPPDISDYLTSEKPPLFRGTIYDALAHSSFTLPIPYFFQICIHTIEKQYLDIEGIYRKSGLKEHIEQLIPAINLPIGARSRVSLSNFLGKQPIHDLTGLMKLYLRQLAEPVIPDNFLPDFRAADSLSPTAMLQKIKLLLRAMPTENYDLIKALAEHFEHVVQHSEKNLMTYTNLATCLGPCFVRTDGSNAIMDTLFSQRLARILLEHWRFLFLNEPLTIVVGARLKEDVPDKNLKQGDIVKVISVEKLVKVSAGEEEVQVPPEVVEFERAEVPPFTKYQTVREEDPPYTKKDMTCLEPRKWAPQDSKIAMEKRNEDIRKMNQQLTDLIADQNFKMVLEMKTAESHNLLKKISLV